MKQYCLLIVKHVHNYDIYDHGALVVSIRPQLEMSVNFLVILCSYSNWFPIYCRFEVCLGICVIKLAFDILCIHAFEGKNQVLFCILVDSLQNIA